MQSRTFRRSLAAVVAAGGLALTGAAAAGASGTTAVAADSPARLQAVKDAAHAAVTARVSAINQALTVVAGDQSMGSDQATEKSALQSDLTGLQQLDATIQADTTVDAAKADAAKVFTQFRIYALVLPSVHMVRAADAVDNVAVPKLTTAATRLQAAITRRNATNLQSALDDMKAATAAAAQATNGLPGQLEGFTPAQWSANKQLLSPARTSLQTARADLRKARQDAKTIVAGLGRK